jgi:hypothetical protein
VAGVTPASGSRARLALAVLVVATFAAACFPIRPGAPDAAPVAQYCAGRAPSSPTDYQAAFDNLRLTYTEWASADESVPINLPGGRVVWVFDDTSIGRVHPDGTLDPSNTFASNSFVVENGACFAPLMGGSPRARTSLIPSPAQDQWYWPTSGFYDPHDQVLRVFMLHEQRIPNCSGAFCFQGLGVKVATFSLPNLTLTGIQALPFDTTQIAYGATSFYDAGQGELYLYNNVKRNSYVARTAVNQSTSNLFTASSWEFWSGDPTNLWVPTEPTPPNPDIKDPRAMQWTGEPNWDPNHNFGQGDAPAAQPNVIADSNPGTYLETSKLADAFSNDVSVFTGPSPAGPWTYRGQFADTSQSGTFAYGAFSRLDLPGTSPTILYNTNVANSQPATIHTYGPHFKDPSQPLP